MFRTIILIHLIIVGMVSAHNTNLSHSTNAFLPNNKMIWPLPKITEFDNAIVIHTEFIESTKILSKVQGDWVEETYYVRYKVIKKEVDFPYAVLLFTVKIRRPTLESGIRIKALPFQFAQGKKTFALQRDDEDRFMKYFKILTYRKN